MGHIHTDSLMDIIHWSRTLCLWDPFSDIWQCLWHPQPFHAFIIGSFAKTFNGWLPLNVVARWLCPTCVRGTSVTSWIDVILIWYHYIVICTLVTIFNWWLSSKEMKLRVLIKEVLIVFYWLTLRIICRYIYVIYMFIYVSISIFYIYYYIYIYFLWDLILFFVGFEPTITEFRSDAITPWVQLARSHFCTATPISSFVQRQISFRLLPSSSATFIIMEIFLR